MVSVYIDSDVIVAAEIETEPHHMDSKEFMQLVLQRRLSGTNYVTSIFTFLELASAMIRRTQDQDRAYSLLYRIRNSWRRSIRPVLPLPSKDLRSFPTLIEALIETAIIFRTHSADTVHAQTVYLYDCDFLVTWNKRHFLRMKKSMKNLKILTPVEMISEFRKVLTQ